jgi:hypothetical protein
LPAIAATEAIVASAVDSASISLLATAPLHLRSRGHDMPRRLLSAARSQLRKTNDAAIAQCLANELTDTVQAAGDLTHLTPSMLALLLDTLSDVPVRAVDESATPSVSESKLADLFETLGKVCGEVLISAVALMKSRQMAALCVPLMSAIDGVRWVRWSTDVSLARSALIALDSADVGEDGDTVKAAVLKDQKTRIRAILEVSRLPRPDASAVDAVFMRHCTELGADIAPSLKTRAVHVEAVASLCLNTAVDVLKRTVSEMPRMKSSQSDGAAIAEMHVPVVHGLCSRGSSTDLADAYALINAHKYYGLSVTSELVLPLVQRFGANGDSRAFNLVDVCTLFSGGTICIHTVAALIECSAVAHDHHRARLLLELLREEVPGVVSLLPVQSSSQLCGVKVLPPPKASWISSALAD